MAVLLLVALMVVLLVVALMVVLVATGRTRTKRPLHLHRTGIEMVTGAETETSVNRAAPLVTLSMPITTTYLDLSLNLLLLHQLHHCQ